MKKIGIFVLVIGLVGLLASLGMNTTVNRVHNIGLLSEKQNFLLVFIAMAFAGVVILVSSYRNGQSAQILDKAVANSNQARSTHMPVLRRADNDSGSSSDIVDTPVETDAITEELKKFLKLKASGAISEEEFVQFTKQMIRNGV